jgi:flagellar biosynthesis protein FliR
VLLPIDIIGHASYADFVNKRHDLLAKYFATLSQIVFGAVVVKQFTEQLNVLELGLGVSIAIGFIVLAYIIQPKE